MKVRGSSCWNASKRLCLGTNQRSQMISRLFRQMSYHDNEVILSLIHNKLSTTTSPNYACQHCRHLTRVYEITCSRPTSSTVAAALRQQLGNCTLEIYNLCLIAARRRVNCMSFPTYERDKDKASRENLSCRRNAPFLLHLP